MKAPLSSFLPRSFRPSLAVIPIAALVATACTLESGRGFSTLTSVELHARFEPGPEREVDGGVRTDLGYVVHFDEIRVGLAELELLTVAAEPEPTDGAEQEHCHDECPETAEDEQTESHAEGEALATLPVDRSMDALTGDELVLTEVSPSRELPEARLGRAELGVTRVEIVARVSEGGLAASVPLSVSLELDAHVEAELDVAITHDGPERLALLAELALEGAVFDGVDFAAAETLTIGDDDDGAEALRAALTAALHLHFAQEESR